MKTMKHAKAVLVATLLLCGVSVYAEGKVDYSVLTAMLEASKTKSFYKIQPANSEVRFSIDSVAGTAKGEFIHFKGGVTLQPDADNNGQVVFVIKSDSVSSGAVVNELVRSKSFIDVARYPEILFVSSNLSWLSETKGLMEGKLTLHGVTKKIAFSVELRDIKRSKVGSSETILVKINTSISRSMFGMKLMSKVVNDTVKLNMTIQVKRFNNISEKQLLAMSTYSGF